MLVLLRGLLVLLGRPVPREPLELGRGGRRRDGHGRRAAPQRGPAPRRAGLALPSPREFEGYMDAVARAAVFLDQLQLGDQR